MSTYYTPELEEFRIGFQYEWLNEDKEWVKVDSPEVITPDGYDEQFYGLRVKHLDRDDIEGEGWKYDNNAEPIPPLKNDPYELPIAFSYEEGLNQYLLYKYKDGLIAIEHILDCVGEGYIFKGFILNLSEFRKLMKQLNIKKP